MKVAGLAAALAVLVSSMAPAGRAQGLDETFLNAMVQIVAKRSGDTLRGSGFVVALDRGTATILTSAHVIEGTIFEAILAADPSQSRRPTELVGIDTENRNGLGLFRVRGVPAGTTALEIAGWAEPGPRPAETLTLIGYPNASAVPLARPRAYTGREGGLYILDSGVGEGSSGGPALLHGKVVGLVTATTSEQSYAVPFQALRLFLDGWRVALGVVNAPLSPSGVRDASPAPPSGSAGSSTGPATSATPPASPPPAAGAPPAAAESTTSTPPASPSAATGKPPESAPASPPPSPAAATDGSSSAATSAPPAAPTPQPSSPATSGTPPESTPAPPPASSSGAAGSSSSPAAPTPQPSSPATSGTPPGSTPTSPPAAPSTAAPAAPPATSTSPPGSTAAAPPTTSATPPSGETVTPPAGASSSAAAPPATTPVETDAARASEARAPAAAEAPSKPAEPPPADLLNAMASVTATVGGKTVRASGFVVAIRPERREMFVATLGDFWGAADISVTFAADRDHPRHAESAGRGTSTTGHSISILKIDGASPATMTMLSVADGAPPSSPRRAQLLGVTDGSTPEFADRRYLGTDVEASFLLKFDGDTAAGFLGGPALLDGKVAGVIVSTGPRTVAYAADQILRVLAQLKVVGEAK